jgi:NAD(P)-dependent dehydrogenase (short-subunit alcohol dehydrogenase family)
VLGTHLLTTLLVPALKASGRGRVVGVSTKAAGGLDLSDIQYEQRRYRGAASHRASKQASRMLAWALAEQLADEPATVNALNPGYVHSALTRNVTGPMTVLVSLTRFAAQTPLDGADTAIWLAASPEVERMSGKFFNKRREIGCRFRDPDTIRELVGLVDRQLARVPGAPSAVVASGRS